jgi:hypothetical protein
MYAADTLQLQTRRHQAGDTLEGAPREALYIIALTTTGLTRLLMLNIAADEDLSSKPFFPGLIECT